MLYFVYDSLRIMECWRYSVALNGVISKTEKLKLGEELFTFIKIECPPAL